MHRRGSGASLTTGDDRSPIEPISVRVPDASRMTGLGRSTIYELIASGDIEAAKVGRATVIMVESIRNFLTANRMRPRPRGREAPPMSRDAT
ncbi:helix-turn-helix domain-containing protein [Sphingopyxis sp.]|uniref:helix-turn-helix domain-containing protein n=1 Tax=Sphingopyxis sp. TaxID=1908224 RepID=UPI003F71122D